MNSKNLILILCAGVLVIAFVVFGQMGFQKYQANIVKLQQLKDEKLQPDLDESDEVGMIFDEFYFDNKEEQEQKHCEVTIMIPLLANESIFNQEVLRKVNALSGTSASNLDELAQELTTTCYENVAADYDFDASIESEVTRKYFHEISYEVLYSYNDEVSVRVNYSLYTGGAHPNMVSTHINFNTKTHAVITLADVIPTEERIAFVKNIYETLQDEYGDGLYPEILAITTVTQEDADKFVIDYNDSFSWSDYGYVMHFDPYEVAPYAAGPVEVEIEVE